MNSMQCKDCKYFKIKKAHYAEWTNYICKHSYYGPFFYASVCPANKHCYNNFKPKFGVKIRLILAWVKEHL